MTRNPDPLFNLADALSEDIIDAAADTLVHDADSGWWLADLTAADRIALLKVTRLYATKMPRDPGDLLQEAMCRVFRGESAWPCDLAHVPAEACPGLDPGWTPVRRQEHAPYADSEGTEYALAPL